MGDSHTWTAAPAAAERARSVLAAAWSCAVTADGGREELVGAHSVADDGRVLLRVPEDSALLAAAICAPRGEPSAVLEFADVAPVPVRGRIRARLWLAGWFAPEDGHLAFTPTRVVLRQSSGAVVVDLDEFATAAPDPLALAEARLQTEPARRGPGAAPRRRPARAHAAHRARPRPRRRTPALPRARRRHRPAHGAHARAAGAGERRVLPPGPAAAAHRRRGVRTGGGPPPARGARRTRARCRRYRRGVPVVPERASS